MIYYDKRYEEMVLDLDVSMIAPEMYIKIERGTSEEFKVEEWMFADGKSRPFIVNVGSDPKILEERLNSLNVRPLYLTTLTMTPSSYDVLLKELED